MPLLEEMPESHMLKAYGVYLLKSPHRFVRRLKKQYEPSVHGHQTWQSSFLVMDYLLEERPKKGSKIMEIGCGWGPASVFCARRLKAEVTGVDMDADVFPFMDVLASLNGVQVTPLQKSFAALKKRDFSDQNLVIGSDICFWDELVVPLHRLIRRALDAGVERVVIADPGRSPFFELLKECRKSMDCELLNWYAVEPKRFEGHLLVVHGSD